ncbi:Glucans biosynthesis glucosyltransferase H [compost metagenome]
MHAVVNPSFNALAAALATARHHLRGAIERNREERVNEALQLGPEKLVKGKRLELLSDPVALSRLHQRVWLLPEGAAWREHYQQLPHNERAHPQGQR